MVGIVPQQGFNLSTGAPGELIMIEPPECIIMEVKHDDGEKTWTTKIACKRHAATLEQRGVVFFFQVITYKTVGRQKK